MRLATHIFSVFFVAVFVLLHLQPLMQHQEAKKQSSCARKSKCSKQSPAEEEKDCNTNKGCNPFVPCSMGSCCYEVENFYSHPLLATVKKQKNVLANDNTLQTALSDCWHPPESKS